MIPPGTFNGLGRRLDAAGDEHDAASTLEVPRKLRDRSSSVEKYTVPLPSTWQNGRTTASDEPRALNLSSTVPT